MSTLTLFLILLIATALLLSIIWAIRLSDVNKKVKQDALYWKEQWQDSKNKKNELQKELDDFKDRIVEVSDTFKPKQLRTIKQLRHDAVLTLQDEIVKSNCLDFDFISDDYKNQIVKLTLLKPIL